jgi:hypothetical protein
MRVYIASIYHREEDDRNLGLAASGNRAAALSPRPSLARARGSRWRDRLTLFFDRRGCTRSEPAEGAFPWPCMPFATRISFAEHRCYSVPNFYYWYESAIESLSRSRPK